MGERPDIDVARDGKLTALYREAAGDLPPPALDAAILAAAHREVAARPRPAGFSFARAWRGPLSVAAVVVLSVSLVMLMREEAPDLVAPPRADTPPTEAQLNAPAVAKEPEAAADRDKVMQEERVPKGLGLKPSHSLPQSGLSLPQPQSVERAAPSVKDSVTARDRFAADAPVELAKRRDQMAAASDESRKNRATVPEAPLQRQPAKTDAYKEYAQAPAAAPARPPQSVAESAAPAAGALSGKVENKAARMAAASADRGEADAAGRGPAADAGNPASDARNKSLADAVSPAAKPAPRQMAPAAPASNANKLESSISLAPEKWLERIGELMKQGKTEEARASLAEFKKRFPDYRLPDALRDGIKE